MNEAEKKRIKADRRSKFIYNVLHPLAGIFAKLVLNFKGEKIPELQGNYLLLANHVTDYDMVFACVASKKHMYYVGSEHIFQHGWPSRLLLWALSPIIRQKGGVAAATVFAVTRALRRGDNVCIFAEGNRCFDGVTCSILPSTGKLARAGGASLVTYRIENGYLTTPRWAYTMRRGVMRGSVVNIYTPEMLRSMNEEEINNAICTDLYEDAYARQDKEKQRFRGKRLAEGLEHALYICPECGKVGEMHSYDDTLECKCGMKVTYDEYGYLHGGKFNTVTEWSKWQREKLREYLEDPEFVLRDEGITLYKVEPDHRSVPIYTGEMYLKDGLLTFGEYSFPMEELEGPGICGRQRTVLMYAGGHFEFKGEKGSRLCGLKYIHAYEHIAGKRVI